MPLTTDRLQNGESPKKLTDAAVIRGPTFWYEILDGLGNFGPGQISFPDD